MSFYNTKYASVATATTAETDSQQSPPPLKQPSQWKTLGLIVLNFLFVFVPMVALSVVLLALVFFKRVRHSSGIDLHRFPQDEIDESEFYYVNMSAATLVYIASWSSTIANTVTGCIVVLLGYPIAAVLVRQPDRGKLSLSNAPQVTLLVELFAGQKLKVIWHWIALTFRRRGGNAVTHLAGMGLSVALLMVAIIVAADAYLHLSTKSVTFTDAVPQTSVFVGMSYELSHECSEGNNTYYGQVDHPCIFSPSVAPGFPNIYSGSDLTIVRNDSTITSVYTYTPPFPDEGVLNTPAEHFSYAYVSSSRTTSFADFAANTFATSTQCEIVTPDCRSNATVFGSIASFDCGPQYPAFKWSNLTSGTDLLYAFTDSHATSENIFNGSDPNKPDQNVFTWGIASAKNYLVQYSTIRSTSPGRQAIEFDSYELFFILCNTSVWNATYTFYNGSVVPDSWTVEPANVSVTNMVQSWAYLEFSWDLIFELLSQSTQNPSYSTVNAAVTNFGSRVSALFLSVAAAGMVGVDPISEQWREDSVVSKVRKSAIYCFVGANLAMALLGGLAFLIALVALVTGGKNVSEALQQLSIQGIVYGALKGPSEPDPEPHQMGESKGQI